MTRARDIASLLDSGGDVVRTALDNAELADDTSPELAADLDVLTSSIVSSSNRDITITPNGTGSVVMSKVDINAGAIDGTTIGAAVAGGGTFSSVSTGTLSATLGADFNNIHVQNNAITSTNTNGNIALTPNGTGEVDISKVDIDAGAVDGITLGTNSAVTEAQVDNININGNAIISTDTNGNIAITPNGTGEVDISKADIDAGTIDGVTIGGSSAGVGTFTTLSATTLGSAVDLNSQALTNANIDSGAVDGITLGTNSAVTEAQIDNININANSIISTNTNGNIILTPNGTGNVTLGTLTFDADQTVGAGQDDYVLTYNNTTGTIGLEASSGGGGGGISNVVEDSSPQLGGSLDVNGQAIVSVSNGNIALTPHGTGEVDISKVDIDSGAIDGTTIGANSAAAGTFTTLTGSGDVSIDSGVLKVDTSNNRIGINNASPQADIDIGGSSSNNLRFTGSDANSTGGIEFYNGDTTPVEVANIGVAASSGVITLSSDPNGTESNSRIDFDVDGAERMHIDSAGLDLSVPITNLVRTQVFTSSGTYTPATGANKALVYCTGGGGGGGGIDGNSTSSQNAISNAGSAGGTAIKLITSLASSYTVTIGAGGNGGAAGNNNGNDGGDSSFTDGASLTLTGSGGNGGAGRAAASTSSYGLGAAGGAASGGDINMRGGDAGAIRRQAGDVTMIGSSGGSFYGGSRSAQTSANARDADAPGAGGGATRTGSATNYSGGDGADGIVVIYEFL